jgi:hypothetical protein
VNCYHGSSAMEGTVPNPYGCNSFYMCTETELNYTTALWMDCPTGSDGTLFYNFRTGQCEYKETAVCFELSDIDGNEHNNYMNINFLMQSG